MDGQITALERAKLRRDSGERTAGATVEISPATESALTDEQARIKVLMVPDATPGNPYQRQLAEALDRREVRVELANPAGKLPLLSAVARQAPIRVLHLHWTHRLVVSDSALKSVLKGVRLLGELAWLRLRGVRLVWTAHNLLEHEQRHPRIELFFARFAERLYQHIIVHCDRARDAVVATYRIPPSRQDRLHTIPHGHFIDSYPNAIARAEARARLGLDPSAPLLLHFGQIRPYKGVFELLDAFESLEAPSAALMIAGRPWDDATAESLRARARRNPRVHLFLDFVPDEEVQIYLNAADVVVLPYRGVLTSGSAMLAMSFGRAVVMPRCGCAEEMLAGEQGAVLYEDASMSLKQAIQQALSRDLASMGEHNRQRAERFGWDAIAWLTERAYRGQRAP